MLRHQDWHSQQRNMDDIVFAGNRALYLILVMSAGPIAVATFVGLLVGLFQTVTQLQEVN